MFQLASPALSQGFRLLHHAEVGSTNDEALKAGHAGDKGRLWIVADEQTKGRGRHGRQWSSPRGNLFASLLLIDPSPSAKAAELGFVAGVSLFEALQEVLGNDPLLCIKWPNDILHGNAKLSGILLESTQLPHGFACVIGFGVNCASHPVAAAYPTTDLAEIGTLLNRPADVLLALSGYLVRWLAIWDEGRNFEAIRAEWLKHAGGLGTNISVSTPSSTRQGIFETIDASGRLVLNADGQRLVIEAGDVFLNTPPAGVLTGMLNTAPRDQSHEGGA